MACALRVLLTNSSMRRTLLAFVSVALASLTLGACGGKIDEDSAARASSSSGGSSGTFTVPSPTVPPETTRSPTPSPTATSTPSAPSSPSKASVEDACATICERNGQCGALQSDCYARCTDDIRTAITCGPEAATYIHCYADNLEGCSPLPPVCESAYCAFARCAGRVVPRYCP